MGTKGLREHPGPEQGLCPTGTGNAPWESETSVDREENGCTSEASSPVCRNT
jgi:hypothetical protein